MQVQSLGQEDPLEEGMATHSSILAWRIPMDRRAWWARVYRVQRVRHDQSNLACTQRISNYFKVYDLRFYSRQWIMTVYGGGFWRKVNRVMHTDDFSF